MTDRQLRHLLALRWRMVRSRRSRLAFAALAMLPLALCVAAVAVAGVLPRERAGDILALAPTAFLTVALVAVLAPLVAGGGNELFPAEQLAAFPVRAGTVYRTALTLSPLNLAWAAQAVGLVGLTAYISDLRPGLPLALVTSLAYLALVTVAGQVAGWLVFGVRARQWGRHVTWGLAAVAAAAGLLLLVTGRLGDVLDASPTAWVVFGSLDGAVGAWSGWLTVTGVLLVSTMLLHRLGTRACAWSLRQPAGIGGRIDSMYVRRRRRRSRPLFEQTAVDRASVWRSASLRRGLLVLGLLPGLVAAAAGVDWPALILFPALVAAGAGLLFGVNAFCLDGSGSMWLASLPHPPSVTFWAKAQVVLEVSVCAVLLATLAGSVRTGRLPTSSEVAALVGCVVVTVLHVVALCMRVSVAHPHRADLRGPRDAPAPPGAMAAYSVRLAVSTTLLALLFSAASAVPDWRLPALLAVPFTLLSVRRMLISARLWEDAAVRARVVSVVSAG